MPTSPQHAAWIRRGMPWRLARPLERLRDRLRGYGYTCYDLGDVSHLDRVPPEHHTPYSEVNWPAYQGRPMPDVVTAIDVMPPGGGGLPSLQLLGAQLFADKQAGVAPWIVDMNWGPSSDRTAVRDTWRPGHVRSSSGDTGHIHLSCRSDAIDSPAADGYDPVARLRGQTGDEMTGPIPGAWDDYLPDTALAILQGKTPRFGYPDATGPTWDNDALKNHNVEAVELRLTALLKDMAAGLGTLAASVATELAANPAFVDALASAVAGKLGSSYFTATTTYTGRILPGEPPAAGS